MQQGANIWVRHPRDWTHGIASYPGYDKNDALNCYSRDCLFQLMLNTHNRWKVHWQFDVWLCFLSYWIGVVRDSHVLAQSKAGNAGFGNFWICFGTKVRREDSFNQSCGFCMLWAKALKLALARIWDTSIHQFMLFLNLCIACTHHFRLLATGTHAERVSIVHDQAATLSWWYGPGPSLE